MYWATQVATNALEAANSVSVDPHVGNFQTYFGILSGAHSCDVTSLLVPLPWAQTQYLGASLDTGFMVEYFITMCVPNKHWFVHLAKTDKQLCNSGAFLDSNSERGGYITQCQSNDPDDPDAHAWEKLNPGTNVDQCPVLDC